jgi:hypothetical protein
MSPVVVVVVIVVAPWRRAGNNDGGGGVVVVARIADGVSNNASRQGAEGNLPSTGRAVLGNGDALRPIVNRGRANSGPRLGGRCGSGMTGSSRSRLCGIMGRLVPAAGTSERHGKDERRNQSLPPGFLFDSIDATV